MSDVNSLRSYTHAQLVAALPQLSPDDNKYTRGHVFAVVGSAAYPGAACLAATAAQRAGAGYTEVICAPESVSVVHGYRPSLVVRPWSGWSAESIPATSPHHPIACLVGSGFDADKQEAMITLDVLNHVQGPLLVDGGAISVLASEEGIRAAIQRASQGWQTVVTPHGGEAARMARGLDKRTAGWSAQFQAMDPWAQAKALAQAYEAIIVLKGPDTYISDGDAVVAMTQGTPALAKAGTGDALAGIISALLAQQVPALDACVLGATLHAEAGSIAARKWAELSVIPEDVVQAIPAAIAAL